MREILLESVNTVELPPEELTVLASHIMNAVPDTSVVVGYEEEEGSGVTWGYAIHMFLPSADFLKDAAYAKVCSLILSYFKKHRKKPHQGSRNHNLSVHDEDGTTLEILSLKPGADELERLPPDDQFKRVKPSKRARPTKARKPKSEGKSGKNRR